MSVNAADIRKGRRWSLNNSKSISSVMGDSQYMVPEQLILFIQVISSYFLSYLPQQQKTVNGALISQFTMATDEK